MSKVGSVSFKMIYVVMIMMLLLSAFPAYAASSAPAGQDTLPPIPTQDLSGKIRQDAASVQANSVSVGDQHTCALVSGGVKCWGYNSSGQLGNGDATLTVSNVPVNVVTSASNSTPLSVVTAISSGGSHTCALMADSTVKCWGINSYGQLGNGDFADSSVPVDVLVAAGGDPLSGVTAISSGDSHTCALMSDKTVKCWGNNGYRELGNGEADNSSVPVIVVASVAGGAALSEVTAISSGGFHTCALLSTNKVDCWGYNASGELGNGDATFTGSNVPVDVKDSAGTGTLSEVTAISSGGSHTCALIADMDKTVKCWGSNYFGQLGNGTSGNYTNSNVPVAVKDTAGTGTLSGVTAISSGGTHTCVLITGATGMCWGNNENLQLGNGTTSADSSVPVAVVASVAGGAALSEVSAVSAGGKHTCALRTGGGIRCWGENEVGQLGNGDDTFTDSNIPVDVLFPTYSISGKVIKNSSNFAGVTVSIGGGVTDQTTDSSGNYSFTGLAAGTYTVTPSMTGYTFSPPNIPVTISTTDETGKDFSVITYSISGKVTKNGRPLATVTLSGGGKMATTNSLGVYTLSGLSAGRVTVTPSKSATTFTPVNQAVTVTNSNVSNINFAANVLDSQFNGNMIGWKAVKGTWTNSTTYLLSPNLTIAGSVSTAFTSSSFTKLDYSAKIYRTGCASCVTNLFFRGSGVSLTTGGWTSGYQFSVTRDGRYYVAKTVASRVTVLKALTASAKINKNSGWNVLRVVASGSSLQFYINGSLVYSKTDASLTTGKVGLGMVSNGSGGANRLYVDYATLIVP